MKIDQTLKDQLEQWYLKDHLTMQEIGAKLGRTRQAIHERMRRLGIDTAKGERFEVVCDSCHQPFTTTRKRFLAAVKHFCCHKCYTIYLHSNDYLQNRTGQRLGRIVMSDHLGRDLVIGEVVHHVDGNNLNNDISNLMLFKSHSEHILFHHKLRQEKK